MVAFHGARSPKVAPNAWSPLGLYNNASMWRTYDWSKVTTIALFAELDGAEGYELLCTAHRHNVRCVHGGPTSRRRRGSRAAHRSCACACALGGL